MKPEALKKLVADLNYDLEQAAIDYDSRRPALYGEDDEGDYVEFIEVRKEAFIAGAQWYREQMMKDGEQIRFDCSLPCKTFKNLKAKGIEIGDKLLIIKE